MLRAHEAGKTSIEDRLQSVEQCSIEDGVELESPYLNLGSPDRFDFVPRSRRRPAPDTTPGGCSSAERLEAAAGKSPESFAHEVGLSGTLHWLKR
jgi:hypothetical protein